MARFNTFQVEIDGQVYSGDWELEGEVLRVNSAYGAARIRLGRADPEKTARAALAQQVAEWRVRRRAE